MRVVGALDDRLLQPRVPETDATRRGPELATEHANPLEGFPGRRLEGQDSTRSRTKAITTIVPDAMHGEVHLGVGVLLLLFGITLGRFVFLEAGK